MNLREVKRVQTGNQYAFKVYMIVSMYSVPIYSVPIYSVPMYSVPIYSVPIYSVPIYCIKDVIYYT